VGVSRPRGAVILERMADDLDRARDAAGRTALGGPEGRIESTFLDAETVIVVVQGDVGYELAQQLRQHLYGVVEAGVLRIVVDLGDSGFVSSLALGALLGAVRRLRPRGGQLRVACSSPNVQRIFELTMLDRALPLYPSVEAATGRWGRLS
jgi:anti-sigma B factor antagonist